jgi:outer membrane protein TolC
MNRTVKALLLVQVVTCLLAAPCFSQQPNGFLHRLLQKAEETYPALQAGKLATDAARKNADFIRSSALPSLDASYQLNYATHNNISGMLYPQFILPISGPPSGTNDLSGVFGSATGLLLNWQPVTFGQRESQIALAETGVTQAGAALANEILQHKIRLANAYLDLLTAIELQKVYRQNIQRGKDVLSNAQVLVISGIKPGVDTALFASELSKAKLEWINGDKNREAALIRLQELTASNERPDTSDSSYFHRLPSNYTITDTVTHPLVSVYNANLAADEAKKKSITKSTSPTLGVWGTTYARGSGVQFDGSTKSLDGLGLQRINYGLGIQLSMPLLQAARIKPQIAQQDLQIRADRLKLDELNLQLNSQVQTAETLISHALTAVAENRNQLQAASFAYQTMLSRYNAGLANYADVVQAQYNLVKTESDDKLTYMAVWKAVLYKAAATGNLDLFLNQVN